MSSRDLQGAGYRLRGRMVRASPRIPLSRTWATCDYGGIELELRQAIEPWHVLGEEIAAGGTARYVDSSVERLQVKVNGMTGRAPCRHLQRPPRAAASDRDARRICRRRPLSRMAAALCLHPTIGVHSPLVFDIVDTWTGRPSAAAPTMSAIPAAAATTPSRSMPTKPKRAASPLLESWPYAGRGNQRDVSGRTQQGLSVYAGFKVECSIATRSYTKCMDIGSNPIQVMKAS